VWPSFYLHFSYVFGSEMKIANNDIGENGASVHLAIVSSEAGLEKDFLK